MTDNPKIENTLLKIANLRRTLRLARDCMATTFDMTLISDVVVTLARQLNEAEQDAMRLVGSAGITLQTGGRITMRRSDRRGTARPQFDFRPASRALAVVVP